MQTLICQKCDKEYKSRAFVTHIKKCDSTLMAKFSEGFELSYSYCACGKTFKTFRNINDYIFFFLLGTNKAKKYCDDDCKRVYTKAWNKGLTKDTHPSIKQYSVSRIGSYNPIHKILNDDKKKKEWILNIKKSNKQYYDNRSGKSFEEFFGEEKALEIKTKQSNSAKESAKKNPNRGMGNKKHTENTKLKIAKKTSLYNSTYRPKTSKAQMHLYETLLKNLDSKIKVNLEYVLERYTIDIAIPDLKIALEVDGDYWHSNKNLGFKPNNPLLEKNIINDKNKTIFLEEKGWKLIRVWESDINSNTDNVLKQIIGEINARI